MLPQLPAKTYRYVDVELDKAQKRECDSVMDEAEGVVARNGPQGKAAWATDNEDSLKWVGGIAGMSECRKHLAMAKFKTMLALVEEYEEQEEPLVVFSAHRGPIDALASRDGWRIITGDTSHEERARHVASFQAGALKGLALTIQAGGVGITLTYASHAIFVDQLWTPALNQQAEDRICRIGQDRGCVYTILRGDHELEHMVAEALESKQEMIAASVDAMATPDDAITGADKLERVADLIEAAVRERKEHGVPTPVANGKREPKGAQEEWAAQALLHLNERDPDRAGLQNSVGFDGRDTGFGNSLAEQLRETGKLSSKQWHFAVKICRKYHRQVGPCPEPVVE